jgi:hypothetical protein
MSEKKDDLKPGEIELKEAPDDVPKVWEQITVYKERTQNREVIEFLNLETSDLRHKGGIVIAVQRQTPQGIQTQPIRHEFEFPEGWTREQCFKEFDEQATLAVTAWQEERAKEAAIARSKIVTPPKGSGTILGPSGKPMNRQERRRRSRG